MEVKMPACTEEEGGQGSEVQEHALDVDEPHGANNDCPQHHHPQSRR